METDSALFPPAMYTILFGFLDIVRNLAQIVIIAIVLYAVYNYLRNETRGSQILLGILAITAIVSSIYLFSMVELSFLLSKFGLPALIIVCCLFQPELRRLFADVAGQPRSAIRAGRGGSEIDATIRAVSHAVWQMSKERCGAIIAFQRTTSLVPYESAGRRIDALVSDELLRALFYPKSALHDGAVVIRDNRIASAGCVFPPSWQSEHAAYGTRHRAAIGITEETDAYVIVVSEETGKVSAARNGKIERGLDDRALRLFLAEALRPAAPLLDGTPSTPAKEATP